ncbi:MAG: mannose-6-phosphate isomerase, class I [Rothia sp. (in: high G+C Gram-positive bacteria)]|nr:mannose-6-phosphate isomerase, class I [Rothia sp. (in: high G+C Gram-positive bacteria)]
MGQLVRLKNTIQNYAWGSHTILAEMRGIPQPTQLPEAEVWVGAHPAGPSLALLDQKTIALDQWVAAEPERILPAQRESDSFPFLLKILAIAAPLSIQVHPTSQQAQAGYRAENAAGIKLTDPQRNYKDQHSKPETVLALTDTKILSGLRPQQELAAIARAFELDWLAASCQAGQAKEILTSIIRLKDGEAARYTAQTLNQARAWLAAHPGDDEPLLRAAAQLVEVIDSKYPGDRGLLLALTMNLLELKPGQAAHTPDGQIHAYLSGSVIEIMNPSDNVMRAGLTPKHVDTEELIKVLSPQQPAPRIQQAQPGPAGISHYSLWDPRMCLTRLHLTQGQQLNYELSGTSALLSVGGCLEITGPDQKLSLTGTQALLHLGSQTPVKISGAGEAYLASYR